MIRPNFIIITKGGQIVTIYPPLQWNETASQRKMLQDVREWICNHYPDWSRAIVYLRHFKRTEIYSDVVKLIRGEII